jgi:hypothetical protein
MTAVVVPAFNIMSQVVQKVWSGLELLLAPVIKSVSEMFGQGGLGGILSMVNSALDITFGIMNGIVRGGILAFEGLFNAVKGLFDPIDKLFNALFAGSDAVSFFGDLVIEYGDYLGGVFEFLGAVLGDVIGVVTDVVIWIKELAGKSEFLSSVFRSVGEAFDQVRRIMSPQGWELIKAGVKDFFMTNITDVFGNLNDWFGELIDNILHLIPNALGGISDEEKKKRDEERELRRKARDDAEKARKDNIKQLNKDADAAVEARDKKVEQHKKDMREDRKKFEDKKILGDKEIGSKKEQLAEVQGVNKDYNDSLALLKQEAQDQGSGFIKDPKTGTVTASAEGTRKGIESEADQKKTAEAAAVAASKAKADGVGAAPSTPATTQESAESLLASLNTKMEMLINSNRRYIEIGEAQLGATKGLSKDLFRSI